MADTITETQCSLCKEDYTPVFEPEEGYNVYPIHCSLCTTWIPMKIGNPVRVALKYALGLDGEALALALEELLVECTCSGTFMHDAGKRCPDCLEKIKEEVRDKSVQQIPTIWNVDKLKKLEPKIVAKMLEKLETKEETLTDLIDRFEDGEIDAEEYMAGLEDIRTREFKQIAVIQVWAMIQGPQDAFGAAEDLELVERYGSRILISIAQALEISTGQKVLTLLTREVENWDGQIQKEIKTFIARTAGGF